MSEVDGRVSISVEVTADADLDVAGVYYSIDVPRPEFVGGQVIVPTATGTRAVTLPAIKGAERQFFRAQGSSFRLAGSVHSLMLLAVLDGPHAIALADRWDRSGRAYTAMIEIHRDASPPGRRLRSSSLSRWPENPTARRCG